MASAKGWCIKNPDGQLVEDSVDWDAYNCTDRFGDRKELHWLNLAADGYTCVPVIITEQENV